MKVLWYCFSYASAEPWIQSLRDLAEHTLIVARYDKMDARAILDIQDAERPDIIIYTGTAGGPEIISPDILARLNAKAPVCFLSGDLSDPPWWPYLADYRKGISLAVNFDGNDEWPKKDGDFTCLCPISPTYYTNITPLADRPIKFGFMGTYTSPSRYKILAGMSGLTLRYGHNVSEPYEHYATFMKNCQIVPNVPISGSDAVRQVKARVVESGLAGCVLLEHVSAPTFQWLTPGEDYIPYDKDISWAGVDLDRMAASLRARIYDEHAPSIMWNRIFKALG